MASKTHKSLRLDAEICERVTALKADGETETDVYSRVLTAGLEAVERGETARSEEAAPDAHVAQDPAPDAAVAALTATVEAMAADADALREQLKVKDRQIEKLQTIATNAQTLQAVTAKSLETSEAKARRGLLARIRDYLAGPSLPAGTDKDMEV
jgi:hypothetical protein